MRHLILVQFKIEIEGESENDALTIAEGIDLPESYVIDSFEAEVCPNET